MDIQGLFPLGLTDFDPLAVQGTLKSLLQYHSSKLSCCVYLYVCLYVYLILNC